MNATKPGTLALPLAIVPQTEESLWHIADANGVLVYKVRVVTPCEGGHAGGGPSIQTLLAAVNGWSDLCAKLERLRMLLQMATPSLSGRVVSIPAEEVNAALAATRP